MVAGHCMQATVHWNIIGFLPQQPHTVLLTGAIFLGGLLKVGGVPERWLRMSRLAVGV